MIKAPILSQMQQSILQHALTGGGKRVIRNYYFSVDPETTIELHQMETCGLVRLLKADNIVGYNASYCMWIVTRLGATMVGLHLPAENESIGRFSG